ncbi:glycosyltransferase [Bosea sp. Leaf344]|uniref:glycosyltransferase n=1 Tax=Bosea sp. Leaf344 TaxID=1736346 RepID=UPI0009E920D5|nr:glycosyltransferase [Bosea sp. Leaf344]
MSALISRIRQLASRHPRVSGAMRPAVRSIIGGYWRVREALEPVGIYAKTKVFWQLRLRWRLATATMASKLAKGRLQSDCILSFMGLRPRIGGVVDSNLIVMIAFADIRHDPRIEREARTLAKANYRIKIVFPKTSNWDDGPVDWGTGVNFMPIADQAGLFCTRWPGFIGDELFAALLNENPFAIHAHDLNMAFIAFAAARRTGAKVVCDFHEWYSENVTYNIETERFSLHSWPQRLAYRWLERHSLINADAVVTVCDSIADAMARELGGGRRPDVVRNIPSMSAVPTRAYRSLKQELGLSEERFVLLYQGGLGPSRLIEPIVEALAHSPACTLVIRGPQLERWGPSYAAIAARAGAAHRLVLAPAVPSRDVVVAARGADAAVYTVLGMGRNFIYALPNKVFEYMAAGLPLLVANYPEVSRLVDRFDVGLSFQPDDPRSIAHAINVMVENKALRVRMGANTRQALLELDAESEWERLAAIYARLRASDANGSS